MCCKIVEPIPFAQMEIATKSNIAFAGKAGNGKMIVDIAVPKEHLKEIVSEFMMMQQKQPTTQPGLPEGQEL